MRNGAARRRLDSPFALSIAPGAQQRNAALVVPPPGTFCRHHSPWWNLLEECAHGCCRQPVRTPPRHSDSQNCAPGAAPTGVCHPKSGTRWGESGVKEFFLLVLKSTEGIPPARPRGGTHGATPVQLQAEAPPGAGQGRGCGSAF